MRGLARVLGCAVVLLVVAAVGLAIALPRLVALPSVRARLADAATSALDRRFAFEELDLELFPPTFVVGRAALWGKADDGDPVARAKRIELTTALSPLLVGIVVIDSAVVEGATVSVVRTGGGLRRAAPTQISSDSTERTETSDDSSAGTGFFEIALRAVDLRDATVVFEDRTVVPSVRWTVRDISAHLFAEAIDSPVRVELRGDFASGGTVTAHGEVTFVGDINLEVNFDSLGIAVAKSYFESRTDVGGFLTGSLEVTGNVSSPTVEIDAALRDARLQLGEIGLSGVLEVTARIDDARKAPVGQVHIDATQAELTYANFFTKPPGTSASVTGDVSNDPNGLLQFDTWKFVMKNLDARSSLK